MASEAHRRAQKKYDQTRRKELFAYLSISVSREWSAALSDHIAEHCPDMSRQAFIRSAVEEKMKRDVDGKAAAISPKPSKNRWA